MEPNYSSKSHWPLQKADRADGAHFKSSSWQNLAWRSTNCVSSHELCLRPERTKVSSLFPFFFCECTWPLIGILEKSLETSFIVRQLWSCKESWFFWCSYSMETGFNTRWKHAIVQTSIGLMLPHERSSALAREKKNQEKPPGCVVVVVLC